MKKSQKGFTIIEVALVLAIGALIFLVIFLAVPALQRNARNDARKRDISMIVDAVASYVSNNPSKILTNGIVAQDGVTKNHALSQYIDTLSSNTDLVEVKTVTTYGTVPSSLYMNNGVASKITIIPGATCESVSVIKKAGGRSVAVVGGVETAKNATPYCSSGN